MSNGDTNIVVEEPIAAVPVAMEPPPTTIQIILDGLENLLESFGLPGGKEVVVVLFILMITLWYYSVSWRSANYRILQLENRIAELEKKMYEFPVSK